MEQISISRFGDFTLDPTQRRLLQAGQDVYLPPKTFELLLYLIRNRGRVIPKDELLEAVWPDVNVVENTLAQRIREIREALGEGAHGARFIKTVPRVGYQFIAVLDDEPRNATASPLISASPTKLARRSDWLSRRVRRRSSGTRRPLDHDERAPDLADFTLRSPVGIELGRISEVSKPLARRQHHGLRR